MIKTFKYGIAVGAAIAGISGFAGQAQAQVNNAVVTTDIEVVNGIDVTAGDPIDFGTWVLAYRFADAFELTMATTGVITPANIAAAPNNSVAIPVGVAPGAGNLTVDVPAGINNVELQMTRGAITNFTGGSGLSLTQVTYETVTETPAAPFAQTVPHPVTVIAGGTPEIVTFGATIAVTAQPPIGPHTATFTATFNY